MNPRSLSAPEAAWLESVTARRDGEPTGWAMVPEWVAVSVSPLALAIYVYLALRADSSTGACFPAQATMADAIGAKDPKTVRKYLRELREAGAVDWFHRRREDTAGQTSNLYVVHRDHPGLRIPPPRDGGPYPPGTPVPTPQGRGSLLTRTNEPDPTNPPPKAPAGGERGPELLDGQTSVLDLLPPDTTPGSLFDDFWQVYPRKTGKLAASKAWARAIKRTSAETVMAGALRFANDPNLPPKDEARFIAHPSTWLNEGRWDDDPLPPRRGAGRQDGFWNELAARYDAGGAPLEVTQ